MFDNTVKLADDGGTVKAVVIVDGPTNGRTVRSGAGGGLRLSIAHQETNENAGFINQRSNVRVEEDFVLDDTDKVVKAYAQLSMSYPKGQVTAAQLTKIVGRLITFMNLAENSAGANASDYINLPITVGRLYAGEP